MKLKKRISQLLRQFLVVNFLVELDVNIAILFLYYSKIFKIFLFAFHNNKQNLNTIYLSY